MPEASTPDFHGAFCSALAGRPESLGPWLPAAGGDGLSVYRNTILKGAIDVLAAAYGTVARVVGEDWLRAAAADYVRERPPTRPSMLDYGADFPEWLAAFPPARDTPYLGGVALLDRLWNRAYFAADAEAITASAVTRLSPDELGATTARLNPSAGLAAFDQTIASLWLAQRREGDFRGFELQAQPEYALVVRVGGDVELHRLGPGGYGFLRACEAGETLLRAAERALDAEPQADLEALVALCIQVGAFSALVSASDQGSPE
ncbi:DNA-binding domain-containing protein [Phenylobacterium sp.]|uniref:HvfC/BufC N-terminal domain-containing protein n=1 Tax=Phenylobacterium sp. TaxID=1871053 RepID=UPI001206195A|nr:DNA-binding domain-containing protein [Phenylobacterium sp.]THD61045.1 MAG: DUF2063 domain-containing protein [Phenylobacterium sp.]